VDKLLNYVKGDLFSTPDRVIAHGVNCQGAFGFGVAGQIRKQYPMAYKKYIGKHQIVGWRLGQVQFVDCGNKLIVNMSTQEFYGSDGKQYVNYIALSKCFKGLFDYLADEDTVWKEVSIPKIGAGLAGGDWTIIEKIIEDVAGEYPDVRLTVYYL
jgi:O-acetyl-ADP-ribose deacetylase (regulator of RNase III)